MAIHHTSIGNRLRRLEATPIFTTTLDQDIQYNITCTFCDHTETLCLCADTKRYISSTGRPVPEETHPDAYKWDNIQWCDFLDEFAKSHHDLVPDIIQVNCYAGYATTFKNFYLTFSAAGELLHARVLTNENSIFYDKKGTSHEADILPTSQVSLIAFMQIEDYVSRNNGQSLDDPYVQSYLASLSP